MNNSFSNNPKFKNLSPIKVQIISEIINKSKNKTINEMLPEIVKINSELARRKMAFTDSESEILMEALQEGMSPDEIKRFNMIRSLMK